MATSREKINQLGFWDDEVKKVSHDKVVLWAYENAEVLVRNYIREMAMDYLHDSLKPDWSPSELRIPSGLKISELPPPPPKPNQLVSCRTLEKVIQQHPETGRMLPRVLGYADLLISVGFPAAAWSREDQSWHITGTDRSILVEAKTTLPSLGELMRQINLYRLVYPFVIVVAPDDSFSQILKDQKIMFVKYEE